MYYTVYVAYVLRSVANVPYGVAYVVQGVTYVLHVVGCVLHVVGCVLHVVAYAIQSCSLMNHTVPVLTSYGHTTLDIPDPI